MFNTEIKRDVESLKQQVWQLSGVLARISTYYNPQYSGLASPYSCLSPQVELTADEIIKRFDEIYKYLSVRREEKPSRHELVSVPKVGSGLS